MLSFRHRSRFDYRLNALLALKRIVFVLEALLTAPLRCVTIFIASWVYLWCVDIMFRLRGLAGTIKQPYENAAPPRGPNTLLKSPFSHSWCIQGGVPFRSSYERSLFCPFGLCRSGLYSAIVCSCLDAFELALHSCWSFRAMRLL